MKYLSIAVNLAAALALAGCGAIGVAVPGQAIASGPIAAHAVAYDLQHVTAYFYTGGTYAGAPLEVGLQLAKPGNPWRLPFPDVQVVDGGQPLVQDQFPQLLAGKDGTLYACPWHYKDANWAVSPVGPRPAQGVNAQAYYKIGTLDLKGASAHDLVASQQGVSVHLTLVAGARITGVIEDRTTSHFLELTVAHKLVAEPTAPDLLGRTDLDGAIHLQ